MIRMHRRYWAIKHTPTGYFLPARRRGKGYTHDDPQPAGGKLGPRLFHSPVGASRALKCWLMGEWREITTYSGLGEPDCAGPEPTGRKKDQRKAAEMEVVSFVLSED